NPVGNLHTGTRRRLAGSVWQGSVNSRRCPHHATTRRQLPMNRNELIVHVLDDLNTQFPDDDWSRSDVKNCLAAIEDVITENLSQGEPVNLSGFLKLYSKATPA